MDAIITYDLSKQYGNTPALCGLTLRVPEGGAFACVGEAGAGKTTVIRLLSGLCRPVMGECSVLGLSPFFEPDKLHAVTGTVLDTACLYESMTLSENLRFFAGINEVDVNDALDRSSFLLHRLDIWESRDGKIDDLPTGVVRRASLARALMHRPKVLLMDEPAEGLDQETADSVRSLLSYLVEQEGVTVLLATRNMEYAQSICDGFVLLKEGSAFAKGSLESLRQGAGVDFRAVLRLSENETAPQGFHRRGDFWEKEIPSEEEMPKIISRILEDGKKLYEARFVEPGLAEIYAAFLEGGRQRVGEPNEKENEYEQPDGNFSAEQELREEGSAEQDGGEDGEQDQPDDWDGNDAEE